MNFEFSKSEFNTALSVVVLEGLIFAFVVFFYAQTRFSVEISVLLCLIPVSFRLFFDIIMENKRIKIS